MRIICGIFRRTPLKRRYLLNQALKLTTVLMIPLFTMAQTGPVVSDRVIFGEGTQIIKSIDGLQINIFTEKFVNDLSLPTDLMNDRNVGLNWSTDMLGGDAKDGPAVIKGTLSSLGEKADFHADYRYCYKDRCPTAEPHFIASASLFVDSGKLCISYADTLQIVESRYPVEIAPLHPLTQTFLVGIRSDRLTRIHISRSFVRNDCLSIMAYSTYDSVYFEVLRRAN